MRVVERAAIDEAIDLHAMAVAIEDAYRAASAGEIEMPPVGYITFPDVGGDCHIKFGHRRGDADFVIKIATGFPMQAHEGAPTGNGVSLVISAQSGQVRAALHDEMLLTDIRTAVGGAIVSRLLASDHASKLLVVGTGVQARRQVEAHTALFGRELEVRVWGRSADAAARVIDDLDESLGALAVDDLAAACSDADIVVTTTAATDPIIDADWIGAGTHITAVGADAPGKHELDPRLLHRADLLVADSRSQCLDHGELSALMANGDDDPAGAIVEVGEILAGEPGRRNDQQVTIADLTGLAAQDIAAAQCVLDLATPPG